MEADTQAHVAFFLTGRRPGDNLDAVDALQLRPALFAGYRDLAPLRYDFPVVLETKGAESAAVASLSGLIDKAFEKAAVGADAERVRKHGLGLEQEIRALVAGGATGTLSELWERAASRIAAGKPDASFEDSRKRLRAAIKVDGDLADCDAALPRRLVRHVWEVAQARKAAQFRETLQRLVLKLSAILQSDFEQSAKGVAAERLQAAMSGPFAAGIDFEAMSRVLTKSQQREAMPAARKRRITELLRVLKSQRFVGGVDAEAKPYSFLFDSCAAALKAYRERVPRQVELSRALVMAELEIDGEYNAERHDAVFEAYGEAGLDPKELDTFPDYLVCIDDAALDAQENAKLMEILSSGLPIKVLLQVDDLADPSADAGGQAPGMRSRQLASLAMGLNEVYVLQSSASNLFQFRGRVLKGVAYRGPAFFNVYSGASADADGLPPYLMAAAAMESRAFPAFCYDPSAGANWAARFCLQANSQVELDWPVQGFSYEDPEHQTVSQDLAFTLVDFLAADKRYAGQLARVPREKWNGSMIPVEESLSKDRKGLPDKVPSVLMVDSENRLQKVIVSQALLRQASRCREMWRSLQELGGVNNSHAQNLLAREQKAWEERMRQELEAAAATQPKLAPSAHVNVPAKAAAPADAAPVAEAAEEPQRNPDEAYIETERCSTCNECVQLNGKMFQYNENQQAYIADVNAGTYAQLVEAAENCQVAVIHPGKPRNPNEPGLDELLKRAEAFL
ncbi:MAG TPA: ferredoxin [Ramlibacter sp.]|nr:ferredoxin [Ramlibacter sp.]